MPRTIFPIAAMLACAAWVAMPAAAQVADHWSVRANGHPGTPRAVASDSDVNNGRAEATTPLQARTQALFSRSTKRCSKC